MNMNKIEQMNIQLQKPKSSKLITRFNFNRKDKENNNKDNNNNGPTLVKANNRRRKNDI